MKKGIIIHLYFVIVLLIFTACPLILEPISATPTIELSDFSQKVKIGEEITLTSTILDVYDEENDDEANWYFIFCFNETPDNAEVLVGEKNENLSRSNFYFVRTEKKWKQWIFSYKI